MQGRFRFFTLSISALCLFLGVSYGYAHGLTHTIPLWTLLLFAGILLFLSMTPFRSYETLFSLAGPIVIPIIFFSDPVTAGLLVAFSSLSLTEFHKKEMRICKFIFNRADLFLAGFASSYVFHCLQRAAGGSWELLWLFLAASTYYLVNHLLYWIALYFLGGQTQKVYSALLLPLIKTTPMSTILGVLFILSFRQFGLAGIGVFLLLLATLNSEASASLMNAKSFLQVIEAFVETLEAKDHYTRGHSERVAELVHKIAIEMRLSRQDVRTFHEAAKLHDIGKIGVLEGILNKEKHLTEEEFLAVKQHPVIGERIVNRVDALSEIAPIIRSHHERWDGRGYPEGLSGESIPLGSRIIAVADTFDAITSDRPYRKALTYERAIDELQTCAGTQFDAQVVRAAVDVLLRSHAYPLCASYAEAAVSGEMSVAEGTSNQ